jgi:protein-disulfide isomerase
MSSRIYDARMELYAQKMEQLRRMVDDILLRKEAEKQGLSRQELESRIQGEAGDISPEEVDAFAAENPGLQASWKGSESSLRTRIRAYLIEEKAHQHLRATLDDLGRQYGVEFYLVEPPLPLTRISVGDSPTQGPPDAPVTVVEFSDYTCSACRQAHETTLALRDAFQGKIRWVFKDFPLDRHKSARRLAEAARCARDQGLFWEYQDLLFMGGGDPDDSQLVAYAVELGMEAEPFERCLKSGRHVAGILEDIRSAEEAGVEATPTFIINGRIRPGTPDPEAFRRLIEAELAHAGVP